MRQEYQRLQGLVDEAFLDADQDRDGKLTRDEFEEWYFVNMVPRPSCAKSSVIPGPSESPSTARTAVWRHQRLLWYLMSGHLGTLARRSVHPASPVLLTKNGPL